MNRFVRLILAGVVFVSVPAASAGTDDEIRKKQDELARIRREIETYEERIKENEKRESSTLDLLDTFDRQALLLRKLVASLREEEKKLKRTIEETRNGVGELRSQVSFLKKHYARYVRSAYKSGRTYDFELLLSSHSINQALVRARYLQRFSEQRRRDLVRIDTKRVTMERENFVLQAHLTEEQQLIAEKGREESRLRSKMEQRKQLLTDIRKNKMNFQREINRRRVAAKDIEQIIAKLIEEERVRTQRETELARERKEPEIVVERAFELKRGKLRWPVAQGKLAARFGNHQHPVLKTITQNTGIDITVPNGTEVYAVAPGEVSTIWWLPSFGNLLILNHYNGYRTVYAHMSEIAVREGEKIAEGASIGKSGESLAGPMLHFEVWKFRDKQDPEQWLRPHGLTHR